MNFILQMPFNLILRWYLVIEVTYEMKYFPFSLQMNTLKFQQKVLILWISSYTFPLNSPKMEVSVFFKLEVTYEMKYSPFFLDERYHIATKILYFYEFNFSNGNGGHHR